MLRMVVNHIANDREVGVPRRMSVAATFVLTASFAALFRLLVLVGADQTWTAVICILMGAVALGQMLLFQGTKPRFASLLTGGVITPLLFVLLLLDESTTRWSTWRLTAPGIFDRPATVAVGLALSSMVGAVFAYVIGGLTAGVFYSLGKFLNTEVAHKSAPPQVSDRTETTVAFLGKWLNPIQPRNPLHGAIAIYLIMMSTFLLLTPLVGGMWWTDFLGIGLILATTLVLLTGNFQLWIYWPIVLAIVGVLVVPLLQPVLRENPFWGNPHDATPFLRIVGGVVGVIFSGFIGWLQWSTRDRLHEKLRTHSFQFVALSLACFGLLGVNKLVEKHIAAQNASPFRRIVTNVRAANGGDVAWFPQGPLAAITGADPILYSVSLFGSSGDAEFIGLRPYIDANTAGVSLTGSGFTNESLKQFSGMFTQRIVVQSDGITDEGFEELDNFETVELWVDSVNVGDTAIQKIASFPGLRRLLKDLKLPKSKVSDKGTLHLQQLPLQSLDLSTNLRGESPMTSQGHKTIGKLRALEALALQRHLIDNEGMKGIARCKSLATLDLWGCDITDDQMQILSQMPKLQRLELGNTEISDNGLRHLANSKSLKNIGLMETNVTKRGVDEFLKAKPACTVRWDNPED